MIVATIRALKMHGGQRYEDLTSESVPNLLNGLDNLRRRCFEEGDQRVQNFGEGGYHRARFCFGRR